MATLQGVDFPQDEPAVSRPPPASWEEEEEEKEEKEEEEEEEEEGKEKDEKDEVIKYKVIIVPEMSVIMDDDAGNDG